MIEKRLATLKPIKPKCMSKEKNITKIVNELRNGSAKAKIINKTNMGKFEMRKSYGKTMVCSNTVVTNDTTKQSETSNLVQNEKHLHIVTQKRPINVIPSLSSPKNDKTPVKSFMATTDKASEHVVNSGSTAGFNSEFYKQQAMKSHNNNLKSSLADVNIVENDSTPVIVSESLQSTENSQKRIFSKHSLFENSSKAIFSSEKNNIPTKVIQLNHDKTYKLNSANFLQNKPSTPMHSQTLRIPDHIAHQNQKPQRCKRRDVYAKRPTKSAIQRSIKNTKMEKMAVQLNAKRGGTPIPTSYDLLRYDQCIYPGGVTLPLAMNRNLSTVATHSIIGQGGIPLSLHVPSPIPASTSTAPVTEISPPSASVLHHPMTSAHASFMSTSPQFLTPHRSPSYLPMHSLSHLSKISPPSSTVANGYDAPLDLKTNRSSGSSNNPPTPPKSHCSPEKDRTLLKVPNLTSLRK